MSAPDWTAQREANRANWDERVAAHLAPESAYDLAALRAGTSTLHIIEEAELGSVEGLRVLHLQCHFGKDTLTLAHKGARAVVGLDFSAPAIATATALAAELGLADRARFVQADLYDARQALPDPASFDLVFVSWGAICWLHDIRGWARIVAHFLKPGGALYIAEGHPAAWVLDDRAPGGGALPGPIVPYFSRTAFVEDDTSDYANPAATLEAARTYSWVHPLGDTLTALIDAGLTLRFLHEHDSVPWQMFSQLVMGDDEMYRWPDKPWLPLSFSLRAEKTG